MKHRDIILITIIGLILFLPFLGKVPLFDWDEINFAEVAREMLITRNYSQVMIDYQPFTEKPPFFFWILAISMNFLGVNEIGARFPNAIIGIVTLISIYLIGSKLKTKTFGWFWILAYVGSFLPHLYFKSAIIDPYFNLFIFLGIYFAYEIFFNSRKDSYQSRNVTSFSIFSGLFVGLAILTKGPVGLLVFSITIIVFWLINYRHFRIRLVTILKFVISLLIVTFIWFGLETIKYGPTFITEFYIRHVELLKTGDAGHGGPFYYHFIVLLIGVFPASILALDMFFNKYSRNENEVFFKKIMIILFLTVLIIFSIVKTKIIHYSSLAYFPLTFLAALFIENLYRKEIPGIKKYIQIMLLVFGILISLLIAACPIVFIYRDSLLSIVKDEFAQACLLAEVNWSIWYSLIGFIYLIAIILSYIFLTRSRHRLKGIILIFLSTMLCVQLTLLLIVPKIEKHTQNAAIEFYKSLRGQDCYIEVLGFKSYAHLFYTNKYPLAKKEAYETEWLISDKIDKPAYFVTKIHSAEKYKRLFNLKELYRKNGFVFLVNDPKNSN